MYYQFSQCHVSKLKNVFAYKVSVLMYYRFTQCHVSKSKNVFTYTKYTD